MKLRIWMVILVAAIVAAAGIFYYQSSATDNGRSGSTPYKEYAVERGTFQTSVTASGVVMPIDRIEIKSKASGRIEDLPVEEGDIVKRGDLICRLDQTDVRAEVDQAQADLDIAQAELHQAENNWDRQQKLFDKGLIAQEILDDSELRLAQARGKMVRARTALDQAKVRFDETVVRSPIDGVILQKYVEAGQIIASGISNVGGGTPIADVADMKSIYIEAGVDEIDVGKIRIGQSATVMAEAYPRRRFEGEIIRIAPEAKVVQNVTLFDVVIKVANEDALLKSGMNATVEITIVRLENVLMVPTLALNQNGGGFGGTSPGMSGGQRPRGSGEQHTPRMGGDRSKPGAPSERVVKVKQDGVFVDRTIEVGVSNFEHTVILSGLNEGDTLGVPMVSRLKAENDRLEERIKSSRSFGSSGSSSNNNRSGGR